MARLVSLANFQQFAAINVLLDQGSIGGPKVIPQCAMVRIDWTLTDGKVAHNVLYGSYGGGFTASSAIAEAIRNRLTTGTGWTTLATFLAATMSLSGVTVKDVNQANLPEFPSTGAAAFGTSASVALPDEVSLVASLKTTRTGPGGRGRMYVPGWATNALGAGGLVNPLARDALQSWVTSDVPLAIAAGGLTWVLGLPARAAYVGITGTSHPARPAGSLPIQGAVVKDQSWDSQRRRGLA